MSVFAELGEPIGFAGSVYACNLTALFRQEALQSRRTRLEGDVVKAGSVVANARVAQGHATLGETPEAALLNFLGVQAQRLETQIDLARTRGAGEIARQKELISGLVRERSEIDQQLARQSSIVAFSWREVRSRRAVWSEQAREESILRQQRVALISRLAAALSELEARVSDAIAALSIMRIVIAHRPETIRRASRVVVLTGGRCVPAETPSALTTLE